MCEYLVVALALGQVSSEKAKARVAEILDVAGEDFRETREAAHCLRTFYEK